MNIHSVMTLVVVIWFHNMQQSNQLEKEHLKSSKKRPYFLSLKSSKQELFRTQKTWYSMLKKISSYINFLNQKKIVFPISEKLKRRTFPYSENTVFHAQENIMLHQLFRSKTDRISYLWKFKTRTFPYSENMVIHPEENIILHQLFESKEDRISHLQKVQNKNFSVFRKHGIPC